MPTCDCGLIHAIGYIRVSTWYEDKISDEIQKTAILEWARRNGRHIVDWVVDLDATGRNFRRKIMQAIASIEAGEAVEIACWKYSRFGRNRHGVAINLARIEKVGGQLQSATEDIDASTAVGEFTRDMLFALASFESNRAGEQWREVHTYRRDHGLPATGRNRFGYLWTPRLDADRNVQEEGYDPDPATERIAGEMYERHVDGQGLWGIAMWLNDEGQTNARGLRWSNNGVTRYLDSGFGAGLLRVHNPKARCGSPGGCMKDDHYIHIPGAHPPVISDDLWQAYKARRELRRSMPPRARNSVFMLSGLLRCGRCQGPAVAAFAHGQPGFGYRCSRKWRAVNECPGIWVRRSLVEAAVRQWVGDLSGEVDRIIAGKEVARPVKKQEAGAPKLERLTAEIVQLTRALDTASEKVAMGLIPDDSYARTRDKLQQQIAQKQAAIEGASRVKIEAEGPVQHREFIVSLLADWDMMPVVQLRDSLARLIRHVVIQSHEEPRVVVVPTWAPAVESV